MTHDLAPCGVDSQFLAVADGLVERLARGDDLSAWALVESSDGRTFMVLLIHDGAGPPRILFGSHRSGQRSLPDRIAVDDLDRDTVARAVATAHARAVLRGESEAGGRLRLVSTGTPSDGPEDAAPAPFAGVAPRPTGAH